MSIGGICYIASMSEMMSLIDLGEGTLNLINIGLHFLSRQLVR